MAFSPVGDELDGNEIEPLAICGFSLKFPQDATSSEAFWEMMMEKRCAMTEFPPSRLNLQGFYQERNTPNTIPLKGGHFIKDDLSRFDADFFSISSAEATAMDPMQRWLLETAYRALENAGIPMETISGSSTAVYTGSFGLDYMLQLNRDAETPPTYAALGFGLSMLANRLSWFFNLHGPSIGLDSACSSTAMAIDIACQALQNKSTDMCMVAGCNLTYSPESFTWMSNINFLSPDSRCFSFDHRANGYARGEGVAVMVMKRLSDAIRDGSTIRAVIRSTCSNEDGKTQGITQPSRTAQERLIRKTYERAGLSMAHTRYFEAHGTGTQRGDPCEAQAIGTAFQEYRSTEDPLFVGAVKSNIGHLEGASALAAVIKAVLVLEKGVIPPNSNFERLNPKIDAEFLRLKFPQESYKWPTSGLRRASINSFGYGGSNSHIVLDDAYNYLRLRHLSGKHNTEPSPRINHSLHDLQCGRFIFSLQNELCPKLLVWSAADEKGIDRIVDSYQTMHEGRKLIKTHQSATFLDDLAYTLDSHRSNLPWRSFALLKSLDDFSQIKLRVSPAVQVSAKPPRIGFIFNGQGSQWFAMGRELMCYASFLSDLNRAGKFLASLGCRWSIIDELMKPEETSNIDDPELGQTLCTILQVALVNLLRRFKLLPSAVLGHSSGEIAAAYAAGHISCESAWKIAYFRGLCSSELSKSTTPGRMISVALSRDRAEQIIKTMAHDTSSFGISIACLNSPNNVTISGEEHLIDRLKAHLDGENVFARKLRVTLAYHSRQMEAIAKKYVYMMGVISGPTMTGPSAPMISSVTGKLISASEVTDPSYWALNMISRVKFCDALQHLCEKSAANLVKKIDRSHHCVVVDHLLEVGPHATLQGIVREILKECPRGKDIGYSSVLRRGQTATETTLRAMGEFYSMGLALNLRAINEPMENETERSLLVNLPEYPFDQSQKYWHESRLSRSYRFRTHPPSQLLGVRSRDWNPSDARWRHFFRDPTMSSWTEQHGVNGHILYPAAGMLVMAIEAAKQLSGEVDISGYLFHDVHFENPIDLTHTTDDFEVQTSLRNSKPQKGSTFEFSIRTFSEDSWLLNCRGFISVEHTHDHHNSWKGRATARQHERITEQFFESFSHCDKLVNHHYMYSFLRDHGYEYGPLFQAAKSQSFNKMNQATADVSLFEWNEDHVIHPVSLDAILHLSLTALTCGGTRAMATSVPSRVRCLWISNQGLRSMDQNKTTVYTKVDVVTTRGFSCSGIALIPANTKKPSLWYDGFELTNVTRVPLTSRFLNIVQQCINVNCKVAIDKMSNREISEYLAEIHQPGQDVSDFFHKLELLIDLCFERITSSMDPRSLDNQPQWTRQYWSWMEFLHAKRRLDRQRLPVSEEVDQSFEVICQSLAGTNPVGRLFVEVAKNLPSILKGDLNTLELLLQSGLLKDYYEELTTYRCAAQAFSFIDLLAHQRPGMKILEVGGGTGSGTRKLISALRGPPSDSSGLLRCSRFDFTDISPVFLDNLREEFKDYSGQMSFGTLDIEQDFSEQGYGDYDIVVAVGVLHITSNLKGVLRNARKALKPGGKLIMQESFRTSGWTLGFVFGLFPGWWLGVEDYRLLSPNMTVDGWDVLLKDTGFSGTDIVLRDFDQEVAHNYGWIISTATDTMTSPDQQMRHEMQKATIIVDVSCPEQRDLAERIMDPIRNAIGSEPSIIRVEDLMANHTKDAGEFIIFLAGYKPNFFAELDEAMWMQLQHLIHRRSRHLLWVSAGGGKDYNPEAAMLDGLTRTLRQEYYDIHLVTLALDISGLAARSADHLMKIFQEMISMADDQIYEQEYVECDGRLHVRRLVKALDLNSEPSQAASSKTVSVLADGKLPFSVELGTLGYAGGPRYVQAANIHRGNMEAETLDILVRTTLLQSSSRLLNKADVSEPRGYCAGIVQRAGDSTGFRLGDHVFAAFKGTYRSHIRVPSQAATKLPPGLSYSQACRHLPPLITAYHALIEIGNVQCNESILIHDSSSPIGQAALKILRTRGIEDIWVTSKNEDECVKIMRNYSIPEERIIPEDLFEGGMMLTVPWQQKFDLVFVTDGGSATPLFVNHVKNNGCYIVLSDEGVSSHSTQRILNTSSISITRLPKSKGEMIPVSYEALQFAVGLLEISNWSDAGDQIPQFRASELKSACNRLSDRDGRYGVIVNFDASDSIDVNINMNSSYELDPNATYVISGGLGGLGRAMARWLASRGARFLLLLSRSGPCTLESEALLSELRSQNVRVETPPCDIGDRDGLRNVLDDCRKRMPRVRGCIQASMVMTERIFQKMEYHQWRATVAPKVKGSWNLHTELPQDLDFFILLSSIMGVLGTGSLAAYNAGNTYQDALARYRISQGQRAIALDLGGVSDGGYLAEPKHRHHITNMRGSNKFMPMVMQDVYSLLEIFCNPETPFARSTDCCQFVVGVKPPALWKHLEEIPTTMMQPFWGHLHHFPVSSDRAPNTSSASSLNKLSDKNALNIAKKAVSTGSLADATELISRALAQSLSDLLGTDKDRIDLTKPMHSYGLDSLSAVALRNWVGKIFNLDLPVFEILGGTTFAGAGLSIARQIRVKDKKRSFAEIS